MKPHSVALSSAFDTDTRLSSSAKLIGSSACGGLPAWMCQIGFSSLAFASSCGYLARKARYSSTVFGITSKNSFLAALGFWNMNSDRLSGEA